MRDSHQDKKVMPIGKIDESKLTTEQKQALEIARAQGASFSRKFKELVVNIAEDDADELVDAVIENRKRDRVAPSKPSF